MNIGNGIFKDINKPARYVGGEVNQIIKDKKEIKCNAVLCYPNIYEKAMSSNLVNVLYTNINDINGVYCKRSFAPDIDFEKLLKENKCSLYSLEDFESIKYSDVIIFVIENELDFTNFINMLDISGILDIAGKIKAPKIIAVTSNKINIKPIAQYIDVIFNCDYENHDLKKVIKYLQNYAASGFDKEFFNDTFEENKVTGYEEVEIRFPTDTIIPSIKIENASIIVDLSTIKSIDVLIETVQNAMKKRGINKVSFVNQDSIGELTFCEIIYRLKMNIDGIRISGNGLDFNKFEPNVLNVIIPCIEKSGLCFDVTTCSHKLIAKLNKGTEKELLLERIKAVFKNNRSSLKLKFYIGLPNETFEDIDSIFELAEEVVNMYSQSRAKDKFSIKIYLQIYIPTLRDMEEYNVNNINKLDTKIRYVKEKKSDPVIKWNIENTDRYITKLLLQNGEKEVSKIVREAYDLGARFDADESKYNKVVWDKVIFDNMNIVKKYTNAY